MRKDKMLAEKVFETLSTHEENLKRKLSNAFRTAEIYHKVPGTEMKAYPSVIGARVSKDKTYADISFRLAKGIDPKELDKKWHVIEQFFTKRVDLIEKDNDNFYKLRIYNSVLDGPFAYDWNEVKEIIKGLKVPILAGKNRLGQFKSFDMISNPTLLLAGLPGSGKSVIMLGILTTLILSRKNIHLHLVDLKMAEFPIFEDIDMVKSLTTEIEDVEPTFEKIKSEIDNRGRLLKQCKVNHIDRYNNLVKEGKIEGEKKPYIILVIDELVELLDQKNTKGMEDKLKKIVSKGRALGVYCIIAIQRPDAETVPPFVKAMMAIRYAFRCADKINSGIILGPGTEEDASTISQDEKGKFYCKIVDVELLQAPYIDLETDFQVVKTDKKYKVNVYKDIDPLQPTYKPVSELIAPYVTEKPHKEEKTKGPQRIAPMI